MYFGGYDPLATSLDATVYITPAMLKRILGNTPIRFCPTDKMGISISIKDVRFSDPATVVFWDDNTKTVVKTRGGEKYDKEKGLAMAIIKKITGNAGNYYEIFKEWCGDEE